MSFMYKTFSSCRIRDSLTKEINQKDISTRTFPRYADMATPMYNRYTVIATVDSILQNKVSARQAWNQLTNYLQPITLPRYLK